MRAQKEDVERLAQALREGGLAGGYDALPAHLRAGHPSDCFARTAVILRTRMEEVEINALMHSRKSVSPEVVDALFTKHQLWRYPVAPEESR